MENSELKRKEKGIWIPIEIWEDINLNWNEKILFLEIDSFTSKDNDCFISNEYISNLLGVSETSANKILSSLIKKGYVIKTNFDGRRRFVKSALSFTTRQGCDLPQGRVAVNDNIPNIDNNIYNIKEDTIVSKKEVDSHLSNSDPRDAIDYEYIKSAWEQICPMLSSIRELNPKRKRAIANTLKNNKATTEDMIKCFKIIASNDFCTGVNSKQWKATFDWIINDTKSCFNRLLEGEFSKSKKEHDKYNEIINGKLSSNTNDDKIIIDGIEYK